MVAVAKKDAKPKVGEKKEVKDGKKLPAVPESVLKHRKKRIIRKAKLAQVNTLSLNMYTINYVTLNDDFIVQLNKVLLTV